MEEAGWITVAEACERFGVSKKSVRNWADSNLVSSFRPDKYSSTSRPNVLHIWAEDLDRYLVEQGNHPDSWPDQGVPKIVDPLPVLGSAGVLRRDQIGNVGEHLVAYYLSFAGASVSLVDRRGMDHFVRMPNGSMFALEVKTASKPINNNQSFQAHFNCRRLDADWFAFLDLSTNVVIFKPSEEVPRAIVHKFFTPFYMNQSIQRLFNYYGDEPDPVLQEAAA